MGKNSIHRNHHQRYDCLNNGTVDERLLDDFCRSLAVEGSVVGRE